jgi:regulator of nonsense transcripts 2
MSASTEPGMLAFDTSKTAETTFPPLGVEAENELVEKDIRDRFKKMCEGYFENVAKKLVLEHKVSAPMFYARDCCDITIL